MILKLCIHLRTLKLTLTGVTYTGCFGDIVNVLLKGLHEECQNHNIVFTSTISFHPIKQTCGLLEIAVYPFMHFCKAINYLKKTKKQLCFTANNLHCKLLCAYSH